MGGPNLVYLVKVLFGQSTMCARAPPDGGAKPARHITTTVGPTRGNGRQEFDMLLGLCGKGREMTHSRKRRWLRFGLRTMLVGVLFLCVFLGWLGLRMNDARKQKRAVALLRNAGGVVQYDFELDHTEYRIPYPSAV